MVITKQTYQNDDPAVVEDRVEQFADLGFTAEEAQALATAKMVNGNYWRVSKVQRMIDHSDCDHALVVELLT